MLTTVIFPLQPLTEDSVGYPPSPLTDIVPILLKLEVARSVTIPEDHTPL